MKIKRIIGYLLIAGYFVFMCWMAAEGDWKIAIIAMLTIIGFAGLIYLIVWLLTSE